MINSSKGPLDFTRIESIQWDSSWPKLAEEDERQSLFLYLEDRFGIPERLFDDYLLFKRKKSWSIIKRSLQVIPAAQLKVSKVGLKAFQKVGAFVKPTTRMIQTFGHTATRARLEIDQRQLERLLVGEELPIDLDLEKGYVILNLGEDVILGTGFYGDGKIRSQIPRKELRKAMFQM